MRKTYVGYFTWDRKFHIEEGTKKDAPYNAVFVYEVEACCKEEAERKFETLMQSRLEELGE